jgi:cyclopropane-fatty-acyl-phospholipid synthase
MADLKRTAAEVLGLAGLELNGSRPFDVQVYDERLYQRVFSQGSLGLGDAYMEGWWDAPQLDEFFHHALRANLQRKVNGLNLIVPVIKAKLFNLQGKSRAFQVGEVHYDLGNEFFRHMLDARMVYTCAYWHEARNLDEAQEAKLDLVCRKVGMKPGMRILDIGCGWGSFVKFAAERYGAECVGITISREQAEFARGNCQGLPIDIRLADYREMNESFDHIISLGMFEHVGHRNHRIYLEVAHRCLKRDGLFLLHTIGDNVTTPTTDPWIEKHIFPNGDIPSLKQIADACEHLFVVEDVHNFGTDYDRTLMAWFANFERHWSQFKEHYGERFHRMWKYYLQCCAGAFRARHLQLWQIVLSKDGVPGGYRRIAA